MLPKQRNTEIVPPIKHSFYSTCFGPYKTKNVTNENAIDQTQLYRDKVDLRDRLATLFVVVVSRFFFVPSRKTNRLIDGILEYLEKPDISQPGHSTFRGSRGRIRSITNQSI